MIKSAFPSCNFVHSSFFVAILASQQQKSENQKILHTFAPLGTQNFGENCPKFSEIFKFNNF